MNGAVTGKRVEAVARKLPDESDKEVTRPCCEMLLMWFED